MDGKVTKYSITDGGMILNLAKRTVNSEENAKVYHLNRRTPSSQPEQTFCLFILNSGLCCVHHKHFFSSFIPFVLLPTDHYGNCLEWRDLAYSVIMCQGVTRRH